MKALLWLVISMILVSVIIVFGFKAHFKIIKMVIEYNVKSECLKTFTEGE